MRRLLLPLAVTGLLLAGCGEDERPVPLPNLPTDPERPNQVRGPGFTTEKPVGFSGAPIAQSGVVVAMISESTGEGFSARITIALTEASPNTSVEQLRDSLRSQNEAEGDKDIDELSDRKIDGEPAAGVTSSRTADTGELTVRSYAVVHAGKLYTIDSTTPKKSKLNGRQALATVLGTWRWDG